MQAGLIPIVNYESCVDVSDFGITLQASKIDQIRQSVIALSAKAPEQLARMARRTWESTRANHSREVFSENYQRVITTIMNLEKPAQAVGENQ